MERLPVGVEGFDLIAEGGRPFERATLVAGTAGGARTVSASEIDRIGGLFTPGEGNAAS
jgi:circadian clock protein KaiC